jgi:hypothetical protein
MIEYKFGIIQGLGTSKHNRLPTNPSRLLVEDLGSTGRLPERVGVGLQLY